jgi:glycosyltransferase involved in cell wall biosynthesis
VKMLGYRSHAESVAWLESADVLFLPLHTPLDGGPTLIVPGKAYEYLGSGRPILAMCPTGDMCDFVKASSSGIATGGADVPAAAAALSRFYRDKLDGKESVRPNRDMVDRFERRALTARLAEAMDELAGSTPKVFPTLRSEHFVPYKTPVTANAQTGDPNNGIDQSD